MTRLNRFIFLSALFALVPGLVTGEASETPESTLMKNAFKTHEEDWTGWSPRPEIIPTLSWDKQVGRAQPGSLSISSENDSSKFGAWGKTVPNITPGSHYTFEAWFRCENIAHHDRSVIPRLVWLDRDGKRTRPPEFVRESNLVDGWHHVQYTTTAPENTARLEIQLGFGFAKGGRVWFDDVSLKEVNVPGQRVVRVATIHHRPRGTMSASENLAEFENKLRESASFNPDIICLPEGITVVGNPQNYIDVSEPVPGPSTERLGRLARKLRSYIVAGIYEREGSIVYNTAVLIDREGKLAGRYRKTHLPREEWEAGLTPGNDYPVFDTDFGRVGLIVCWDVQFPEPSRAMALKGAELLLLPIWGGSELLTRARAQENHVFLVSSSYDMRSFVVDPTGKVIGEATDANPIAVTEVNLDQQILQPWLGDMSHRTWKERRPDIPVE